MIMKVEIAPTKKEVSKDNNWIDPDRRLETQLQDDKSKSGAEDNYYINPDKRLDDQIKKKDVGSAGQDAGESDIDSDVEKPEYPCKKEIGGQTCYFDDNGNMYRVGDDLLPNAKYEINGYKYETDDKRRIISAEGKLHLKEREGRKNIRDSIEAIGKGDQKEGDDRGHLIGDQFDGSNGLENMIPQDAKVNECDFKYFENELAKEVKDGKEVYVKIEPVYEGDSRRPVAIMVTYTIDGKENVRIFPNSKE